MCVPGSKFRNYYVNSNWLQTSCFCRLTNLVQVWFQESCCNNLQTSFLLRLQQLSELFCVILKIEFSIFVSCIFMYVYEFVRSQKNRMVRPPICLPLIEKAVFVFVQ